MLNFSSKWASGCFIGVSVSRLLDRVAEPDGTERVEGASCWNWSLSLRGILLAPP
jgi:hypothetical protein